MQNADSFEKTLILGRLSAGGEGDDRGWDGWMASLTQWTWVWVDSRMLVMHREAWHVAVHGIIKSQTQLSDWTELNWYWNLRKHKFINPFIYRICLLFRVLPPVLIKPHLLFSHSVVSDFATSWTAAYQAFLFFTISWSLLMSIGSVMPSNHLILCHPLLLLPSVFPSIRVFSNESVICIRWPKYWSFSFSISPSNEYSGLMSFRIDWFDSLLSKGFSRVFSRTTVWKHQFFCAQPFLWSSSHISMWQKPQGLCNYSILWVRNLRDRKVN